MVLGASPYWALELPGRLLRPKQRAIATTIVAMCFRVLVRPEGERGMTNFCKKGVGEVVTKSRMKLGSFRQSDQEYWTPPGSVLTLADSTFRAETTSPARRTTLTVLFWYCYEPLHAGATIFRVALVFEERGPGDGQPGRDLTDATQRQFATVGRQDFDGSGSGKGSYPTRLLP